MKALVLKTLGSAENIEAGEVDTPEPGPGQVRVALRASALNRRDVWITVGAYPRIELPCIGGSDGAGVIDAVGTGVDEQRIGGEVILYPARDWGEDPRCGGPNFRVLGMPDQGTFAEYICAAESDVYAKPAHLSWHQAAALPLAGLTAWRATVTQGKVQSGQKVLVTGIGGGVATFALTWALNHGADVYVTSSSAEKIETAKDMGALAGLDYRQEGWGKTLGKMSGGIDLVIDSAGGPVLNESVNALSNGGTYVFFGATLGNPEKGLEMAKVFFKQLTIQGTTMGMPSEFATMIDFVNRHKIVPQIDRVFGFGEAKVAYQRLWQCEQMGKIVFDHDL